MILDKKTTRATWFNGFDDWQIKFNDLLFRCAKTPTKTQTMGKAFLQDVMIPFMDIAKDRLLVDIAKQVQTACEKATRLDRLVNKENE